MKKIYKIAIISALTILGLGVYVFWEGSTKAIEAEVNRLAIPKEWKLTHEEKVPPKFLCLEKNGCPSIVRSWKLDRVYSKEELEKMFIGAEANFNIEAECSLPKYSYGAESPVCSGVGKSKKYKYMLYQVVDHKDDVYSNLGLRIYINENIQ